MRLLYTKDAEDIIFEALGITTDNEGYLCKKGSRILDFYDKKPIKKNDLGAISKDRYSRDGINSLLEFSKHFEDE
jgi:hypothetical protein